MARPTPVFPLVGSTMVPPGASFPSLSACSIMRRPIRSFTLPPGFRNSSLARSVGSTSRESRWRRTSGVFPTRSRTVGWSPAIGRNDKACASVPEVAPGREDDRALGLLDRRDDLVVPLRAAGLDDRPDAGLERESRPVGEGEEGVGGEHGALDGVAVLAR